MKKYFLLIIIILTTMAGYSQETPPPVASMKQLTTSTFYINPADSAIWQYKGTTFGWHKVGKYKDVTGLGATVVHKTGAETIAGIKTLTSSPIIPDATTAHQAMALGQADIKYAPVTGGVNYIQNRTGSAQTANSWITGVYKSTYIAGNTWISELSGIGLALTYNGTLTGQIISGLNQTTIVSPTIGFNDQTFGGMLTLTSGYGGIATFRTPAVTLLSTPTGDFTDYDVLLRHKTNNVIGKIPVSSFDGRYLRWSDTTSTIASKPYLSKFIPYDGATKDPNFGSHQLNTTGAYFAGDIASGNYTFYTPGGMQLTSGGVGGTVLQGGMLNLASSGGKSFNLNIFGPTIAFNGSMPSEFGTVLRATQTPVGSTDVMRLTDMSAYVTGTYYAANTILNRYITGTVQPNAEINIDGVISTTSGSLNVSKTAPSVGVISTLDIKAGNAGNAATGNVAQLTLQAISDAGGPQNQAKLMQYQSSTVAVTELYSGSTSTLYPLLLNGGSLNWQTLGNLIYHQANISQLRSDFGGVVSTDNINPSFEAVYSSDVNNITGTQVRIATTSATNRPEASATHLFTFAADANKRAQLGVNELGNTWTRVTTTGDAGYSGWLRLLTSVDATGFIATSGTQTGLTGDKTTSGTWTFRQNALGTSTTDGINIINATAAILGTPQVSPSLHISSNAWGTTAGTSQSVDWRIYSSPFQGGVPTPHLVFAASAGGATYSTRIELVGSNMYVYGMVNSARDDIKTSSADGFLASNSTPTTSGVPVQNSPRVRWSGTAWNTTTFSSNSIDVIQELRPASGAPSSLNGSSIYMAWNINGSGYADKFGFDGNGVFRPTSGVANATTNSNGFIGFPTTGISVTRNVADANPSLTVDNVHASNTGNILNLNSGGVNKVNIDKTGAIFSASLSNNQAVFTNSSGVMISKAVTGTGAVVLASGADFQGGGINISSGTYNTQLNTTGGANYSIVTPGRSGTLAMITQNEDFEVTSSIKGLILKSPDGTRWRLTVSNAGDGVWTSL